jgi:serine protease
LKNKIFAIGAVAGLATLVLSMSINVPKVNEPALSADRTSSHITRTAPPLTQTPSVSPPGIVPSPLAADIYVAHEVVVRVHDNQDINELARSVDGIVTKQPGPAGLAVINVASAPDPDASEAALYADPRVQSASPNARLWGACHRTFRSYQWHLAQVWAWDMRWYGIQEVVVAVVDSGVAYDNRTVDGQTYVRAQALDDTTVWPGWDFVDDDAYPFDEHQHGTHIATTILGSGEVFGSAPGASLMPIRVLDENNAGSEQGLLDGIYWAINHGADVINLSLSFHPDYVASPALDQALWDAHAAGIVLVGAAGNNSTQRVTFPAAHPAVIAVAASTSEYGVGLQRASYSNFGAAIDIAAPGGVYDADLNGDGWTDGILAETIAPNDPSETGYWLMAGTSQAAAVTSGAAASLLAMGVAPEDVVLAMQIGTTWDSGGAFETRHLGAGNLDIDYALTTNYRWAPWREAHVGIFPWLRQDRNNVVPQVDITVLNEFGEKIDWSRVLVTMRRPGVPDETLSCDTGWSGTCTVYGEAEHEDDFDGAAFTVETVAVYGEYALRPTSMLYHSPEFERLLQQVDETAAADRPLGFKWDEGWVQDMGTVAESYTLQSNGTGFATLPIGVIFGKRTLGFGGTSTTVQTDAGPLRVDLLDLDGTGFATLPIGLFSRKFAWIDGTGFATLPIGISPKRIYIGGTSTDATWLSGSDSSRAPLAGSELARVMDGEHWTVQGYSAASLALGSSTFAIEGTAVDELADTPVEFTP